jgi:hypothetical protein
MPQDPKDIARLTGPPSPGTTDPILKTNASAPDGTNGAFNLSPTITDDNRVQSKTIVCRRLLSQDVNVGDIVIAGVWTRAASVDDFLPGITALITAGFSDHEYIFEGWDQSFLSLNAPLRGGGQ